MSFSRPSLCRADRDVIVEPEPLEEATARLESRWIVWQRVLHDLAETAASIHRIEQALFERVDREEEIRVRVSPVDQDRRGSRRQPIVNADGVGHSNRHVVQASVVDKADVSVPGRTVASVRHDAVPNHRAAKELGGGVLLDRRERSQARRLRNRAITPQCGL